MRTENDSQLTCELNEVKAEDGHLVLTSTVRLELPVPPQDERLPAEVERTVEEAGQEVKRWMYGHVMQRLDAELVLSRRRGKQNQGFACHGRRSMTFKTVFGTVHVRRRRIVYLADQSSEIPSANAWNTPQQVTITRGLIDATCDAMLQESSRKALRHVEERAGEPGLLSRVTVLNLVHEEGQQVRAAARERAEQVFQADPDAAQRLLPQVAEPSAADQRPPTETEGPWAPLVGFPGAPTAELSEENAQGVVLLVGALLAKLGVHQGQLRLLFVNDGARWIRDWFDGLKVKSKTMVLCWYHLAKRCFADLGTACGRKRAEEIGKEVLSHLWEGRADEALAVLTSHRQEMRVRPALDQLVQYIQNRRPYLPDYKQRRQAGLWIASNRVEKLNDWTVSQRCKHKGMDWTREGVLALAVLESARRNGELPAWRRTRTMPEWRVSIPLTEAA